MIETQVNGQRPSIEQTSATTRRSGPLTAITTMLLFAAMVLTGCGESENSETSAAGVADDSSEQPTGAADTADAVESSDPAGGNAEWDDDDKPWRSDDVEYTAVATGLKVALSAERVEVDGTTLHIYLEDGARIPGGPCLIARTALPDDATAIVYQDGTETPC